MILSYIHLDGWATALTSWLILKETESKGRPALKTDISGGAIKKKKKQVSLVEMSLKEQFKCRSFSFFPVSTERSRAAPNKSLRTAESLGRVATQMVTQNLNLASLLFLFFKHQVSLHAHVNLLNITGNPVEVAGSGISVGFKKLWCNKTGSFKKPYIVKYSWRLPEFCVALFSS